MTSHKLIDFLRRIPQSNEDAVILNTLVTEDDLAYFMGIATMLNLLGCISYDPAQMTIRASSQTAKYALNSLAYYVETDQRIISDWHTRGLQQSPNDMLTNGATFLHALETQRLQHQTDAPPTRYERVAQILITRHHAGKLEYLMQYDRNAGQYQFIGGRAKDSDTGILHTAIREIEEEVQPHLTYEQDYQLRVISESLQVPTTLSPTFGALTSYTFTVYHMTDLRQNIDLSDADLWVPVEDILDGAIKNQAQVYTFTNNDLYTSLSKQIEGGLANLTSSFTNADAKSDQN
jgi:8-oxo-dGTP pyrophosphatase MutT (NUDIX family)